MRAAPRAYSTSSGSFRKLRRAPLAVGRKHAELRGRPAFAIHQQRADGSYVAMGIEHLGEAQDGSGFDFRVVVEKENVFRVGSAPSDIEGFGQAEVLGKADELDLGEAGVEIGAAVGRAIVDQDHLKSLASFGFLDGVEASPKQLHAVVGDDHDRNARRLFLLFLVLLGGQVHRIAASGVAAIRDRGAGNLQDSCGSMINAPGQSGSWTHRADWCWAI